MESTKLMEVMGMKMTAETWEGKMTMKMKNPSLEKSLSVHDQTMQITGTKKALDHVLEIDRVIVISTVTSTVKGLMKRRMMLHRGANCMLET